MVYSDYDFSHEAYTGIQQGGSPIKNANLIVIGLHGKGGNQEKTLNELEGALGSSADISFLAPQSAGGGWWNGSASNPPEPDDPRLAIALAGLDALLEHLAEQGFGRDRIILTGISQGSSLVSEYIASDYFANDPPLRGVLLSGGVLNGAGVDGANIEDLRQNYPATVGGNNIVMVGHSRDPNVPLAAYQLTEQYFSEQRASVSLQLGPDELHGANYNEVEALHLLANFDVGGKAALLQLGDGSAVSATVYEHRGASDDSVIVLRSVEPEGVAILRTETFGASQSAGAVAPSLVALHNGNLALFFVDPLHDTLMGQILYPSGEKLGATFVAAREIAADEPYAVSVHQGLIFAQYSNGSEDRQLVTFDEYGQRANVAAEPTIGTRHRDTALGSAGADLIDSGDGKDKITGRGGDDTLISGGGSDEVTGHEGDDLLIGGAGADLLLGGLGDDTLFGNDGDDHLIGGPGDDELVAGRGYDRLAGGSGADTFLVTDRNDIVEIEDFKTGVDRLVIDALVVYDFDDLTLVTDDGATEIFFAGSDTFDMGTTISLGQATVTEADILIL